MIYVKSLRIKEIRFINNNKVRSLFILIRIRIFIFIYSKFLLLGLRKKEILHKL